MAHGDKGHPAHMAHHWDTPKQQYEAGNLGMWLFLATEVLLFGGLFCGYSVWRSNHPEIFKYGAQFLDTTLGAVNTAVLLLSSMTMAMGVTFAMRGKKRATCVCLVLTLLGAFGFLGIKYVEYSHKFHEGFLPGFRFYEKPTDSHLWVDLDGEGHGVEMQVSAHGEAGDPVHAAAVHHESGLPALPATAEASTTTLAGHAPEGLAHTAGDQQQADFTGLIPALKDDGSPHGDAAHEEHLAHPLQDPVRPALAQQFFTIYFLMTGLHGIHVAVGVVVISWLLILTMRNRFNTDYWTPIHLGGLYWHIVDVIWIFLFPLFYLI